MVYRIYVEKKPAFRQAAASLRRELSELLMIGGIEELRIVNRYDVEGLERELFDHAVKTVFSEPQVDEAYGELEAKGFQTVFAVEYLPGQFDQRAESAAECIQLITKGERPLVKSAKVYLIRGFISPEKVRSIKKYLINPVEAREAALGPYATLRTEYPVPTEIETLTGFADMDAPALQKFIGDRGLAMDAADLECCRDYFRSLHRDPTITEIRVIDTYWSDHCRHTTFNTIIDSVKFNDPEIEESFRDYEKRRIELHRDRPVTLMDIGTIAAKYLKSRGLLERLDESEEINACTVKIDVDIEGRSEKWLLLFKNETHNHPTEIEPFGGAATCIGGAIRDPLSGRSYVYAAMRLTGAADPLRPVSETIKGKLPQRRIVTGAAAGYSSYGNQVGLATGQVDELYHPGYAAKRMEIGAVVAAAPEKNVIREKPVPGDIVILLGGRTGRDGMGGATGASKPHTTESLESCGAEVQKGNAPEERKLQRLFRNPQASRMIKRCNDFGAGGVAVAIGELAAGLKIDLNKVPKKYEGLDGTELAISESQERMAVVLAPENGERFTELARAENLEATIVAEVTAEPYLRLCWNGRTIADISREFLDTNGAEKHIDIEIPTHRDFSGRTFGGSTFSEKYRALVSDLNVCSRRGLSERFDSTIGAGTVLMPFGGEHQRTPAQVMANLVSVEKGHTRTCSAMSWGFNPYISSASPYHGAYLAVVESVSKLIASGAGSKDIYLSFQEYFEKLGQDPLRWGKPLAALLGAYRAQMDLGIAAIGGKDSMSGSFEDIDVPPTLVSFAVTTTDAADIISPEFKGAGHKVFLLRPDYDENNLPRAESLLALFEQVTQLIRSGRALAVYTPCYGGAAEAVFKMCMGRGLGFTYSRSLGETELFSYLYGSFVIEAAEGAAFPPGAVDLGETTLDDTIRYGDVTLILSQLIKLYEDRLEPVYTCNIKASATDLTAYTYETERRVLSPVRSAAPRVLIPVFPGTNCEYDTARAFLDAGAEPEVFVINNLSPEEVARSVEAFAAKVKSSQIIFIPGGFSGGDEPDGSGKFITAFFRNAEIKEAVTGLLDDRGGLVAGICNGFQALIKLGLLPYGRIFDELDASFPTLTYNEIGRHQSRLVRTRVASNLSPWMAETRPGDIFTTPVSHGEGRFIASEELISKLAAGGQILTQYVDLDGRVSSDIDFNPNGSCHAIEGITSPDGRVLGKMAHVERTGRYLYKNVPGRYDMGLFRSAVKYFR